MIITVTENMFVECFRIAGRGDQFSRAGFTELFEYITETECIDDQIELDVISLCCDYIEYKNIEEYNSDFGTKYDNRESVEGCVAYLGEEGLLCAN